MKNAILLLVGSALGIGLAISCGDGMSPDADAAAQCECAASEAPLKSRLVRVTSMRAASAMSFGGGAAFCPAGATMLSGGCLAGVTDPKHLLLSSGPMAGEDPTAWDCVFYNGTTAEVTSTATVLCLKPAP